MSSAARPASGAARLARTEVSMTARSSSHVSAVASVGSPFGVLKTAFRMQMVGHSSPHSAHSSQAVLEEKVCERGPRDGAKGRVCREPCSVHGV